MAEICRRGRCVEDPEHRSGEPRAPEPPAALALLQRTAGNHAVSEWVARSRALQRAIAVGGQPYGSAEAFDLIKSEAALTGLPASEIKRILAGFDFRNRKFTDVGELATAVKKQLDKDTEEAPGASFAHTIREVEKTRQGVGEGDKTEGLWYTSEYVKNFTGAKRQAMFMKFGAGQVPGNHFVTKGRKTWKIAPNATATVALNAFFDGMTICDCGSFKNAVVYKAILDLWGPKAFDDQFGPASKTPLFIEQDPSPKNPAMQIMELATTSQVKPGDLGFIRNHPCYKWVRPDGEADGWHVMCVGIDLVHGEPLWNGLGMPHPMRPADLLNFLIDDYNSGLASLAARAKDVETLWHHETSVALSPKEAWTKIPNPLTPAHFNPQHAQTQYWLVRTKAKPPGFDNERHFTVKNGAAEPPK